MPSSSSRPHSIRFRDEDWEEIDALARIAGITPNKWVVRAARGQAELEKAENAEKAEAIAERERIRAAAFPQGEAKCPHKFVPKGNYCYECRLKKW